MTEDDVAELLEEIEAYDERRTFTERHITAWHRVAVYACWDLPGALAAVTAYYADRKTWISPADITTYLRDPVQRGERICEY